MQPAVRWRKDGVAEVYDADAPSPQPALGWAIKEGPFPFWIIVLASGERVKTGTTMLGLAVSRLKL